MLDWIGVAPGTRVLDLGCGRGALAVEALRRGAVMVAIDAAPGMVRELAASRPGIDARVMDAHRLDFADGSFDLVVSGFVVHLLADPGAADILAGFEEITGTTAEVHLPLPTVEAYWDWACSHGSRAFIDALPGDRRAEYRQRLLAAVAGLEPLEIDRGAEFWMGRKAA